MNFGENIWYAKRINDYDAEQAEFGKPIQITTRPNYLTVMPAETGGYLQILKHGDTIFETWIVCINERILPNLLGIGDLLWVDGAKPNKDIETLYGNGASANAVVDSMSKGRLTTTVTLKRNQKQVLK